MPCPPHRMPETTASTAIGHSRSGVTKSQIRGTTEIPKEQTTRTGRAPNVSTRRPHAGAETMRSAATMIACAATSVNAIRSEEHTSELQSLAYLVCRLLLEKKKKTKQHTTI